MLCLAKLVYTAPTAISGKRASFPAWALSAPTGCMLCQSKASGWGAVRHEHWCHSHMDSGVVMLGGWETELCWPAAAETAVEGFTLVIVLLLWTRSSMMYFVISAMKGKSTMHADRAPRVTSREVRVRYSKPANSLHFICKAWVWQRERESVWGGEGERRGGRDTVIHCFWLCPSQLSFSNMSVRALREFLLWTLRKKEMAQ